MENWQPWFTLIIAGAAINLVVAFGVFWALASVFGISPEVNTPRRALESLLTIIPVAGVAGAPFVLIPFIGPFFGFAVSAFVAPMLMAPKYSVSQATAAKIILPTVAVIYVVSAVVLWYGIPMAQSA